MVRKLKFTLRPTSDAVALQVLISERDDQGWPEPWQGLESAFDKAWAAVEAEAERFRELVECLEVCEGTDVMREPVLEDSGDDGLCNAEVDVDLREALADEHSADVAAEALVALLEGAAASDFFVIDDVKLGNQFADAADAAAAVREQAEERGIVLDPAAHPDVDFGEDEVEEDEDDEEEEPEPPPPKAKAGAGSKHTRSGGSFGGLGEDDGKEQHRPRPGAAPRLTDDENMFLQRAELKWPCSSAQLDAGWKQRRFEDHPDRNRDNPNAHHIFTSVKSGYEALKARRERMRTDA